jgi:enterochelin esterase family protein
LAPVRAKTGCIKGARDVHQALEKTGIKYESPGASHEWQAWRRDLHKFAPLLFQ